MSKDRDVCLAIKQDLHYALYALANSAAMNGINETTHSEDVMTWWRVAYKSCTGVFAVICALCVVFYIISRIRRTKKQEA